MKKKLTASQSNAYFSIIPGIVWIIIGIYFIVPFKSPVLNVVATIITGISVYFIWKDSFYKSEEDEMSTKNHYRAGNSAYLIASLSMIICYIIFSFSKINLSNEGISGIFLLLLGITSLIKGILFAVYESNGEF